MIGFSFKHHPEFWVKLPLGLRAGLTVDLERLARFSGVVLAYKLYTWDRPSKGVAGWRRQQQTKYVPLWGEWSDL